jgi:hypothetical protein
LPTATKPTPGQNGRIAPPPTDRPKDTKPPLDQ